MYILKSDSEEWNYVGITEDLDKRLARHNKGQVRSTKSRKPYNIVYFEEFESKTDARKREIAVKNSWSLKQSLLKNNMASSSNG